MDGFNLLSATKSTDHEKIAYQLHGESSISISSISRSTSSSYTCSHTSSTGTVYWYDVFPVTVNFNGKTYTLKSADVDDLRGDGPYSGSMVIKSSKYTYNPGHFYAARMSSEYKWVTEYSNDPLFITGPITKIEGVRIEYAYAGGGITGSSRVCIQPIWELRCPSNYGIEVIENICVSSAITVQQGCSYTNMYSYTSVSNVTVTVPKIELEIQL